MVYVFGTQKSTVDNIKSNYGDLKNIFRHTIVSYEVQLLLNYKI
jgi:hypothetical protein